MGCAGGCGGGGGAKRKSAAALFARARVLGGPGTGQLLRGPIIAASPFAVQPLPPPGFNPIRPPPSRGEFGSSFPVAPRAPLRGPNGGRLLYVVPPPGAAFASMWAALNRPESRAVSHIPRGAIVETFEQDVEVFGGWNQPHPRLKGQYTKAVYASPDGTVHTGWIRSGELVLPPPGGGALTPTTAGRYPASSYAG